MRRPWHAAMRADFSLASVTRRSTSFPPCGRMSPSFPLTTSLSSGRERSGGRQWEVNAGGLLQHCDGALFGVEGRLGAVEVADAAEQAIQSNGRRLRGITLKSQNERDNHRVTPSDIASKPTPIPIIAPRRCCRRSERAASPGCPGPGREGAPRYAEPWRCSASSGEPRYGRVRPSEAERSAARPGSSRDSCPLCVC